MRRISISILAFFIAMPAFSDARLPVVNLSSGSVSARAMFGESSPVVPVKKNVVARSSVKKTVAVPAVKTTTAVSADSGENFLASDVLSPRRPSDDLWARNNADMPLRMPSPDEFSVYRTDSALPEESLDSASMPRTFAYESNDVEEDIIQTKKSADDLDAQIAHLVELQRRAEESVKKPSPRVIARPIAETPRPTPVAEQPKPVRVASVRPAQDTGTDSVSLRRLVVPMENQDVVVRAVEKSQSPKIASVRDDMTKMSPSELRRAFRKTFLSENKHLSTYQIDDRFDVASDMSSNIEGFTSARDLSEDAGVRTLEIKIKFRDQDSALSRENYNLLSEYAALVVRNPKRAIQVAIPVRVTTDSDARKLTARRLALVEQVLQDTGVSQDRIVPVLSQRDEQGFVLRVISNEQYESLTQQKRDIFGDKIGSKTYKNMSW